MSVLGLHRPGSSVLHRLPAGTKLAVLVIAGTASFLVDTPLQAVTALATVLTGYAIGRVPARVLLASVRPVVWVLGPLAAFQALVAGWQHAVVVAGVLLALVLLANLVTVTTRTGDLVDVVVSVSRRLRLLGAEPERVGLLLNLAIRSVPLVVELTEEIRQAHRARGLALGPRALAVPLVVGALRRAEDVGEALAARGFE